MFEFDKFKIEIIDDKGNDSENGTEKSIPMIKKSIEKNTSVYILLAIICCLVFFIIGMRLNFKLNDSLASEYYILSTSITEEHNTYENDIRVNINTDNVYELTLLPGIASAKANAIINYRKENGDFEDINELKNVKGIGEATFNNILPYIYVE